MPVIRYFLYFPHQSVVDLGQTKKRLYTTHTPLSLLTSSLDFPLPWPHFSAASSTPFPFQKLQLLLTYFVVLLRGACVTLSQLYYYYYCKIIAQYYFRKCWGSYVNDLCYQAIYSVVEMKRVAFNHILLKKPAFSTILSCAIRSKKAMLSAILFVLLITRADIQLFSFLNYKEFAHQIPNAAKQVDNL